ncbi:unnamed protein product [Closterium sp. NIES-54]
MAGNTSAGAGESSAQDRSGSQDSGVSAPRGARTNQGSLIKEVLKSFTIEMFNGEGNDDWAWKMQLYFRQIGLLKLMIGKEPRPRDPALQEDWDERASAGYYLLSQSLELNQRHHVMHLLPEVDCGPKAWIVLKELHAPTSVVAMLMLERELSALRLSEGEPVQPVLDKMRDLYSKLATARITYSEQIKCLKMLSQVPESWLQFTSGLSLPQNQSLWTLEWVRTKILEEDFRRNQLRGGDDGSSGYRMQGGQRGRGRGFGGAGRGAKKDDDSNDQQGGIGWGRGAKSGRGGKSGAGGKMKGSCWNQKNGANMVSDSSDNNPKSNGGAEKKKERTAGQFFHIGELGEQGDASAKVGADLRPLDYWVLDTGTAWTMTPRKELLDDVRAAPINEVCSASGHALKVAGAGRVAFKGEDGKPVVLHDVLLVPDLKANLISLRKLAKAGVSSSTDEARTYKGQLGNQVLWDLHESKDVYRSMWQLPALAWHGGGQAGEGSASQGECNAVGRVGMKVSARSGETDWATAHRRLGHVAMPLLKQLEKDGAVKVLKLNGQPPDDYCEICLLSKFTRFPFHSVTGRSKKPLELVHMDLAGPLPVQGHKGEQYFLTIVDDWSRLMWAYPLKQKEHAVSTIKEYWLPCVEKQADCVVKRIRTDRGGEFLGAETTAWLKKQGIQRELTTAYTPQSNGVAERANRIILKTARALLIESKVGNSMWPHAVRHATVARNRVLTKVGNEPWVPLERWLGRKPPVDMLRVFGCMAVAHVPKKYRSKLGASAIWCVHLGLAAESKGWLLWEPSKGVLFDSRDVFGGEVAVGAKAARPDLRCLNIDAGEGAVRVVLEREVAEDVASVVLDAVQRRTTTPTTNNEVSVGVTVRILDVGASREPEKRREHACRFVRQQPEEQRPCIEEEECTAGQFFHIGEQGEQGDASAKVGAELHPLDYWVLDTGAASTMTPRKELLEDVRAAPINEVCSASGHALKVAGTRRAAFKGADAMPVVLHDILLVPDLKANLISLRKLAKAGVGEEPRPSDPTLQKDWDKLASAGYYFMSQILELNQRHHVMHLLPEVDCGAKAWTVLKELHAPTSVVTTLMLERELSALRLSKGEPVQPVLDNMRDLYAKLAIAGITYPEETKCLKMLSLLPESWLQFTSGLSLPQNQSLWTLEWVQTKILEENFRRRQLRGRDDGSCGYGMQGSRRGRRRGFGGAGRGAKKDDDSNDQQGGIGWGRGAKSGRGGKSGAGGKMKGSCWMAARGGTRKTVRTWSRIRLTTSQRATAVQRGRSAPQPSFDIGEHGEQGDASAKVGAELHPLDYWVLDTGAAWMMTLRKELLDDVRAAPINKVCSASGHALKVAGAGRVVPKYYSGTVIALPFNLQACPASGILWGGA